MVHLLANFSSCLPWLSRLFLRACRLRLESLNSFDDFRPVSGPPLLDFRETLFHFGPLKPFLEIVNRVAMSLMDSTLGNSLKASYKSIVGLFLRRPPPRLLAVEGAIRLLRAHRPFGSNRRK